MEILLTLTYVALCVAIFKIFRIPVNQWTLATAALGGIFGLALLFITMAYNHPFSTNARIYFTAVPILPSVRGRVIEVPVENRTNVHLEAVDVLFKIDPKPYEYIVEEKRAGLATRILHPLALRTCHNVEAIIGQIYPATLLAS